MVNTLKNGVHGTVFFANGDRYRGEWLNDKRHGNGCTIYKNGDKYFGQWDNDNRQGNGAFYECRQNRDHLIYRGEWKANKPDGYGVFYNNDGCRYEGQWQQGKRCGQGRIMIGNGGVPMYEGEWLNDLRSCIFKNRKIKIATDRDGRGTERYPNGDIYIGNFEKDVKAGLGSLLCIRKGRRLDGVWKNGMAVGGSYRNLKMHCKEHSEIPVLEMEDAQARLSEIIDCHGY